jgi:primosomal protein N' (replication factor Y)
VLVPEIALTPQVAALFRARFGAAVAIQHSGLSDGERHDQWHRIRRGDVGVVIGTRSAVFAPLHHPGLIIVDEEHDTSYKQDETPRYHGRDVAIMRGKFSGALVVLGSATPTIESYANALAGRYSLVTMARRVLDRPLARVEVVNMREEIAETGEDVVLSRALMRAMGERLERGEQSLILLNRRGFATAIICRQCSATLECPNCSISLTVHRRQNGYLGRCHYCNYQKAVPNACEKCAAPYLERVGFGTERVEAEVRRAFPQARVARVDRDTVRRKGSLVATLAQVARREVDVLIGTQMIAKGHDFPEVTLVGVISADVGLGLADFRSAERTFQLLTQVAGRAGRGERAGEAIVQSLVPNHYSIKLACAQDYRAFYEKEVTFRRAMRYPPQVAMVNIVVRGRTFADAMDAARAVADAARGAKGFAMLGPAPAPLTKLRGEHRAQFFLKGTSRKAMREALQLALSRKASLAKRVTIDVDPLTML